MTERFISVYGNTKPKIMGILNLTEDSFFDGNKYIETENALFHLKQMVSSGADIIDIGAESSKPGSNPLDIEIEIQRLENILQRIPKIRDYKISVDTSRSKAALLSLKYGAEIINDIYALNRDPEMVHVISQANCKIVLMHMQGTPQTMQTNPIYGNIVEEICVFFEERINYAVKNGVKEENIILDPGIGFGKNLQHNINIINNIPKFRKFGLPLLLGVSRKSFIGSLINKNPGERIFGTAAVVALMTLMGVDIIRVHDVCEMNDVITVTNKIIENNEAA